MRALRRPGVGLTERTGAPLAEALGRPRTCCARHRARAAAAAAAGPRASMAVLACLPLAGPAVGLPSAWARSALYSTSSLATGSLALGVVLAAFGWWWSGGSSRR